MTARTYPTFDRLEGASFHRYYQLSACKRFSICWVGVKGGWLHEAWFIRGKDDKFVIATRGPIDRRSDHLVDMTMRALYRECIRYAHKNGITAKASAA